MSRITCGRACDRQGRCQRVCVCANAIAIPIFKEAQMTVQDKIARVKAITIPPRKVLGAFDTRFGKPVAIHNLFGDSTNRDTDDTSEHSNLGMACDLINCEISGESGPGCGHNCDHVARATECLQNYARDEAMRNKHRDDAGQPQVSVRFAR